MSAATARRGGVVLLAALALAATVVLALVSLGKWSDPLIDSGREWIVPDALARGRLLYRDVVYWFGPLTPYFHAALFRVFGSGFGTLALAGALAAAATLAALFAAVVRVADRASAALWTALAIPALVFMPNSGGAIVGMGYRIWHAAALSLLALLFAGADGPRGARSGWAGVASALAGLCRVEWGLAALAACALVLVRRRRPGEPVRLLALLAAFAAVSGAVWAFFLARAGARALLVEQPVFLLHIPKEIPAGSSLAGLRPWREGLPNLVYSACVWYGAWLALELVTLRSDRVRMRSRLRRLGIVLVVAAVCAGLGALEGPVLLGAAPLVCLVALVRSLRGGRTAREASLSGFGAMGLLASHRRFFFLGDAPYVAPPLLFAFVAAAGLAASLAEEEAAAAERPRLAAAYRAALGIVAALAFAARIAFYLAEERVPIRGTAGMLTAPPETARAIEDVAGAVASDTPPGSGLVVFPEGEVVNFLSGRPNPLRHELYLPGYLTEANESDVLAELERARPAAIVVWRRPTAEYGHGLFGEDYGRSIAAWIAGRYAISPIGAPPAARAHAPFTLYRRRDGAP